MCLRVAVVAGFVVASTATAALAATPLNGDIKLTPFSPQKACEFSSRKMPAIPGPIAPGTVVLLAQCGGAAGPRGSFSGSPATRGAGYGWNWYLAVGKNGKTTGLAVELGTAVLVPARGAQITLQLTGVQRPAGPQTSTHAKGFTKGTWRSLTRKGSGTYTFSTERKGSVFTTATLHLEGSLR